MTSDTRKGIVSSMNRTAAFFMSFVVLFVLTVSFLGVVDMLPDASGDGQIKKSEDSVVVHRNTGQNTKPQTNTIIAQAKPELPIRIKTASVGMDIRVLNPSSTKIEALDEALLKGAVRYPTSAKLGVEGTVLLFGHSSYLPVVHNQNYKGFNGIQNLKKGETISVYSDSREYRYSVVSVRIADATEDVVELPTTGKRLVLVTCDTFTKKTSRFVVTADLVGTYSLGN